MRSHLDPDNPAPVDDLDGYQMLVQKEPHTYAVNFLQMLLKRIDRINLDGLIW